MKMPLCLPLLRQELRANWRLTAVFAAVLAMYSVMVVSMFDPALGESLEQMAQSMPQLFAAFGMSHAGVTLLEFIANYLYGFLFKVFPLVLSILLADRLLARRIDRGSLACLLAQPLPRWKLALTQAAALVLPLIALTVWMGAVCAGTAQLLFPAALDGRAFLTLHCGLAGLLLFLAAVCWLSACVFGGTRLSLCGAGLCAGFVLLQMLAQAGEAARWLRFATPLTLFDPAALAAGESRALWAAAGLYAGAAALFGLGTAAFAHRDLSL